MNYAQVLAGELRGAFERQDHPAFTRLLSRMVAAITYTGPNPLPRQNDERLGEDVMQMLRSAGPAGPVEPHSDECTYEIGPMPGPARIVSPMELMKGTANCLRADGCQCGTWPQAKTCMYRR